MARVDTGTHEWLHDAGGFIETIEKRHGQRVTCQEEIACRMGFIDLEQLAVLAEPMRTNSYGGYLLDLLEHERRG
jgi:glucose-1-phosphate thymidylyltransferase